MRELPLQVRFFLTDTAAQIIFSTTVGALVETFIADLTPEQVIATRLSAIPVILLAGRPYGIYRDWLLHLICPHGGSQLKAALADTIANVSFQGSLYAAILLLNGASTNQTLSAVGSVLVISAVLGRPYGMFFDVVQAYGLPGLMASVAWHPICLQTSVRFVNFSMSR